MRSLLKLALPITFIVAMSACDSRTEKFEVRSELLSNFLDEKTDLEAEVLLPHDYKEGKTYPVVYWIHGFGGDLMEFEFDQHLIVERMKTGKYPSMIHVYPIAQIDWGHTVFADSANNGPWGKAFTKELVTAIEEEYSPGTTAAQRFVSGHSSGGWSAIWLQVTYPDMFNGAWAVAPDSMDFRDFTGINIYSDANAYTTEDGEQRNLERDGKGGWKNTLKSYVVSERADDPVGGQFFSFNAVFSESGSDGMPKQLFDWDTGEIDPIVAESWRKYDITQILVSNWETLVSKLSGKLHVYVGDQDTFRLEGAAYLLRDEMAELDADVETIIVEGRDHFNIRSEHEEHWPNGVLDRIYEEMATAAGL